MSLGFAFGAGVTVVRQVVEHLRQPHVLLALQTAKLPPRTSPYTLALLSRSLQRRCLRLIRFHPVPLRPLLTLNDACYNPNLC